MAVNASLTNVTVELREMIWILIPMLTVLILLFGLIHFIEPKYKEKKEVKYESKSKAK